MSSTPNSIGGEVGSASPPASLSPVADFVARLRARRRAIEARDWTPPAAPETPDLGQWRLSPTYGAPPPAAEAPWTIDDLRAEIPARLRQYLGTPDDSILLVRVPPGIGKTHGAADVVQSYARSGYRVLWAGPRHAMFAEVADLPHFDARLWYHWRPISGEIDDAPACRHADRQAQWMTKGYASFDLCRALCLRDGWMSECPYRRQSETREKIIFAQHKHLTTGIAIDDFGIAVVDELPLAAFVSDRLIRVADLATGAVGPVADLVAEIARIAAEAPDRRRVAGRDLWRRIGPHMADVLAAAEVGIGLPPPPRVAAPDDVARVPYNYFEDFLIASAAELKAHESGWEDWNSSVWITRAGLHILTRAPVWERLPEKVIVLDGTARPELYEMLFRRPVTVYAPNVKRSGRLFQVAGRLNGRGSTVGEAGLSAAGREAIEAAGALLSAADRPGLIVWKSIADDARRIVPAAEVMTFGALRGSNHLSDCDAVAIIGTHTPNQEQILDLATAISEDIGPFFQRHAETGARIPLTRFVARPYAFTEEGVARLGATYPGATGVERQVREYWHPVLRAIHEQLREAELIQAIHRARINVRPAVVWLLTSTPTDEAVDGLFADPPIAPAGIDWRVWIRLRPMLEARHASGDRVTYADIAATLGATSEKYYRDRRYLDAIAAFDPDHWATDAIRGTGRGRPRRVIVPRASIP